MSDWTILAKEIADKSDVALRPAPQQALSALQQLGIPDEALTFFAEFEPVQCAEIENVRLWPVQEIVAENEDYVPGCYINEFGYIVFATTLFGDAFCFDLNAKAERTPIVLISHDGYDWDEINSEKIGKLKKLAAPDFESFLQAFVDEQLDIQPNYEPGA